MEKKTRIKGTWVNIQHVKKTQKKTEKERQLTAWKTIFRHVTEKKTCF